MQQLVLMVDAPTPSVVLSAIVSKDSNQSTVEKHAKVIYSTFTRPLVFFVTEHKFYIREFCLSDKFT